MRFLLIILLLSTLTGFSGPRVSKPTAKIKLDSFYESKTSERKSRGPQPKIDIRIYDKPAADSRKVAVIKPKMPRITAKTKYDASKRDPNHGKVREATTGFERSAKHVRKRSHIAE